MTVKLISVTPDAEKTMAYVARVSNPSNQDSENYAGLLRYCIKHNHWSVFEQSFMTLEIETNRGIAAQILRHRSFTFQEFCMDGDSKITISKKDGHVQRIPIKELYEKWKSTKFKARYARSYDSELNRFIDAPILSVYKSGEKPVYEYTIKCDNSVKTIRCTKEHRVFTKEMGFVPFGEAYSRNLTVALNGVEAKPLHYQQKENLEKYSWMGSTKYAEMFDIAPVTSRKWFRRYGIIPENPNNWTSSNIAIDFDSKLQSFMKWSRNNVRKSYCEKCGHNGSKNRLEMSHIIAHDKNSKLAFDESNLQTLCSKCHRSHDISQQQKRFGWTLGMGAKWGSIVSQEYLGIRETYDIEMNHHTHNFVADGVVVHNSQRYADANLLGNIPVPDLRRQDTKNRQNSIDDFGDYVKLGLQAEIANHFKNSVTLYNRLLSQGVAKECSRFVLPLATPTRIYMTGSCRSWITYIALREKSGTQKEHMDIAKECKIIFAEQFPICYESLGGNEDWNL